MRVTILSHGALAGVLLLLGVGAYGAEQTQLVYRSVGPDGEVVFSDTPASNGGSEAVPLRVSAGAAGAQARADALIEQQLTVAQALESSRLARERARAEEWQRLRFAAELRAAQRPAPVLREPSFVPWWGIPARRPRPVRPKPAPEQPPVEEAPRLAKRFLR